MSYLDHQTEATFTPFGREKVFLGVLQTVSRSGGNTISNNTGVGQTAPRVDRTGRMAETITISTIIHDTTGLYPYAHDDERTQESEYVFQKRNLILALQSSYPVLVQGVDGSPPKPSSLQTRPGRLRLPYGIDLPVYVQKYDVKESYDKEGTAEFTITFVLHYDRRSQEPTPPRERATEASKLDEAGRAAAREWADEQFRTGVVADCFEVVNGGLDATSQGRDQCRRILDSVSQIYGDLANREHVEENQ